MAGERGERSETNFHCQENIDAFGKNNPVNPVPLNTIPSQNRTQRAVKDPRGNGLPPEGSLEYDILNAHFVDGAPDG